METVDNDREKKGDLQLVKENLALLGQADKDQHEIHDKEMLGMVDNGNRGYEKCGDMRFGSLWSPQIPWM